MMIITPTLAMTYYNPTLSGEDYVIGGMKWLGENGDHTEYVAGYQLRPLAIYTNMTRTCTYNRVSDCSRYLEIIKKIFTSCPSTQIEVCGAIQRNILV